MRLLIIWLFVVFLLAGCRSAMSISDHPNTDPVELSNQMLFIVFHIQARKPGKSNITMVNKTIATGKVKSDVFMENTTSSYLQISIRKGNRVLCSSRIDHPLFKDAEYTKPDGSYSRKTIDLDEAEFFIRCRYDANAESVEVEEVINSKKVQNIEFKIKP